MEGIGGETPRVSFTIPDGSVLVRKPGLEPGRQGFDSSIRITPLKHCWRCTALVMRGYSVRFRTGALWYPVGHGYQKQRQAPTGTKFLPLEQEEAAASADGDARVRLLRFPREPDGRSHPSAHQGRHERLLEPSDAL